MDSLLCILQKLLGCGILRVNNVRVNNEQCIDGDKTSVGACSQTDVFGDGYIGRMSATSNCEANASLHCEAKQLQSRCEYALRNSVRSQTDVFGDGYINKEM